MTNSLKDKILEMLRLKMNCGEIARALGISRNSVAGFRRRNGGNLTFGDPRQRRKKGEHRQNLPIPVRGGGDALAKVQQRECLYPLGEPGKPGFRFCREPREGLKPYCGRHQNLCAMSNRDCVTHEAVE